MNHKIINQESKDYPLNLKGLSGAPQALYVKGDLRRADALAVAIVGSRKGTARGRKLAHDFSLKLAGSGVAIVSGLARGIDTSAHQGALAAGGRTIAVLGSGIDIVYPAENSGLFEAISKNGAILTEFPPGTRPLAKNFLERNRIISGLALVLLVIEGERRSGTLSTTAHAANQGREVFAIPGSPATDFLIKEGARVCQKPQKILDCLSKEFVYPSEAG